MAEGFATVEDVAFVPVEELGSIEGFDESVAAELKDRAQRFIDEREERLLQRRNELGVAQDLVEIPGLTSAMLVALGEAGVKTRDDLADLASDELVDRESGFLKGFDLSQDDANAIIMAARAHWFDDEPAKAGDAPADAGSA